MQKKLTITIDEEVYWGLREEIVPGKRNKLAEKPVRPHVAKQELESAYKAMAEDTVHEKEAHEWVKAAIGNPGGKDPETSSG